VSTTTLEQASLCAMFPETELCFWSKLHYVLCFPETELCFWSKLHYVLCFQKQSSVSGASFTMCYVSRNRALFSGASFTMCAFLPAVCFSPGLQLSMEMRMWEELEKSWEVDNKKTSKCRGV